MSVLLFLFSVSTDPWYLEYKIKQELFTGGLNMQFVMGEGNISGQYNFLCNPGRSQSIATLHGALFHKMTKIFAIPARYNVTPHHHHHHHHH